MNLDFLPSRAIALYMMKLFVTRSLAVLVALVMVLLMLDLLGESSKILGVEGNTEADLWRYAVLYIHGGVYLDIKVVARRPLAEIFNSSVAHDRYTWYSVLANKGDHIFNGE